MTDHSLQFIHHFSTNNASLCRASARCGCFYCLHIFPATAIYEYWDDGQTATCPICAMDAVLPSSPGILITERLLSCMRDYAWDGLLGSENPFAEPAAFIELD